MHFSAPCSLHVVGDPGPHAVRAQRCVAGASAAFGKFGSEVQECFTLIIALINIMAITNSNTKETSFEQDAWPRRQFPCTASCWLIAALLRHAGYDHCTSVRSSACTSSLLHMLLSPAVQDQEGFKVRAQVLKRLMTAATQHLDSSSSLIRAVGLTNAENCCGMQRS